MGLRMDSALPAFVAEYTLGKLTKWLRLAGFDTLYDSNRPSFYQLREIARSQKRIVLTRTHHVIKQFEPSEAIFITSNAPHDQIRQILRVLHLRSCDLKPFTRCVICNCALLELKKELCVGAVPDYIWQTQSQFKKCHQCFRVYWPGTHSVRIKELISTWFS